MILRLLLVALLGWFCGFVLYLGEIGDYAKTRGDGHTTQAIVVLTGGTERISQAFDMLLENKADLLFVSGAGAGVTVEDLIRIHASTAQKKTRLLERKELIHLGYDAADTKGNAQEVYDLVTKLHLRSIRLVTSIYHMPRAMAELKRLLPPSTTIIADAVVPEGFMSRQWWQKQESYRFIFHEYHKFLAVSLGL